MDFSDEEERLQYNESFDKLHEINEDIVAWLSLGGTNIDFPVVQGNDNLTYLNKDIYGDFALSGSVFLDYRCNRNFDDDYFLIYEKPNRRLDDAVQDLQRDRFGKHESIRLR